MHEQLSRDYFDTVKNLGNVMILRQVLNFKKCYTRYYPENL